VSDSLAAFKNREAGRARNGTVQLRNFDRGVVETFGGKIIDGKYYLLDTGVKAPPNLPGVPINFAFPEDTRDAMVFPMILVERSDISPALSRFHPGTIQYRAPAIGSLPFQVTRGQNTITGYTRMAERPQAVPFDISYSIYIYAYRRGVIERNNANALLEYVMRWYQPYTAIEVYDSENDRRVYFANVDSISPLDEAISIGERTIGWQLSMTVEAELDLNPELTHPVVQSMEINMKVV